MKAQLWEVWITEGMMAAIHNSFFAIREIYIPDLKLAINCAGVHHFEADRYSREPLSDGASSIDPNYNDHLPKLIDEKDLPPDVEPVVKIVSAAVEVEGVLAQALENLFGTKITGEDE
jgi:hypothetical protein